MCFVCFYNTGEYIMINHPFPPLYDENSKILILGSFPSVKSREQMFFYGHPQNRFWRVMEALFQSEPLLTVEDKKQFLLAHHIALWDVIAECDICGSSDSSIQNVVPTDLSVILQSAPIEKIFANGAKAFDLYRKYSAPSYGKEIIKLPSTSPANAAYHMERLLEEWKAPFDAFVNGAG